MKFTHAAAATALSATVLAAPVSNIESRTPKYTDFDILNYALTLEHLEATFYADGLKNYTAQDFKNAGFSALDYQYLQQIAEDEATHVSFLTSAISAAGGSPVPECNYSFPATTAKEFLALSSILEGVGVSAYLGAAQYISNKAYLTAAGSILTVESRHSAFIRDQGNTEIPFPSPFDVPLDLNEVYTLAAPFITGCPASNSTLPVKAFPSLSVLNAPSPAKTGDEIYLITAPGTMLGNNVHAAWGSVTGPIITPVDKISSNGQSAWVTIPKDVYGQSYVVLIHGSSNTNDANIVAGPAIIEVAGPYGN